MRGPLLAVMMLLCLPGALLSQESARATVDVAIETDEADALLAILSLRRSGRVVPDENWKRLFASEGYRRWVERERSLDRSVDEAAFRAFVESDSLLGRAPDLAAAIDRWRALDPQALGARALAYLPSGASIRATLYPIIKPTTNSFVFDVEKDPAIFISVDPDEESSKTENTLVHELHHIGTRGAPDCEPVGAAALPPAARTALDWTGAFLEGIAVLAAAGSPDVHPHAGRDPEEFVVWERDVAGFNRDLEALDDFLRAVLNEELSEEEARRRGFSFINTDEVPQGAFYTVGWKMAAVVERAEGREIVLKAVCDMRVLLVAWNRVAAHHARSDGGSYARWSDELLRGLAATASDREAVPSDEPVDDAQ